MSRIIISSRNQGSYGVIGEDTSASDQNHVTGRTANSYGELSVLDARTPGSYGVYNQKDTLQSSDDGVIVTSNRTTGSYGVGYQDTITSTNRGATIVTGRTADTYGTKQ